MAEDLRRISDWMADTSRPGDGTENTKFKADPYAVTPSMSELRPLRPDSTEQTLPESPREPAPPRSMPAMLAEFRILKKLGSGGMGDVYLGHDTLLDRPVAIKVIRELDSDDLLRQQLIVEARAAARIQHPNVVTIYRVGEVNGLPFIVSEFVRGSSLSELPRPLPPERALEIGLGLARGLAAAHRRGVLHRDIKPGNALLTDDGAVKLLDFGLAKLFDTPQHRADQPRRESEPARGSHVEEISPSRRDPGAIGDTTQAQRRALLPISPEQRLSVSSTDDDGLIVGTPHFMAPETWTGAPASRRVDVYAVGVLLFELVSGRTPHEGVTLQRLPLLAMTVPAPRLASVVPGIDPGFAAIVDRCLALDPAERFPSGEELREALEVLQHSHRHEEFPEGNPYRGLLSFEAEHRALFFGRDPEIGTILERLRADPFVLVAGDSGSGKSSLCRAGVVPRVADGALDPHRRFVTAVCLPGRRPARAIARALAAATGLVAEDLEQVIHVDPIALRALLLDWAGDGRGIMLFVDQLEELVTISDPDEARIVSEALAELGARSPSVRLLATVRGDFLSRAAALPALGDELARGLYLLRPLSSDKLEAAIVGPAKAKGVSFESQAMVEELVASTARAQGGMPLLQFALAELWEARTEDRITASSLERIGGVEGALARHADHVLDALPQASQAAARRALRALVTSQRTRARKTEEELVGEDPEARVAVDAFVRGRILVAREAEGGTAYELAHEALVRGWATLRRLLDDEEDERLARERLGAAAAEWDRLGRIRDTLWGSAQLAELEGLELGELGARDVAFLQASRRLARRARILRGVRLGAVPILVLAIYAVIGVQTRRELGARVGAHERQAAAQIAELDKVESDLESYRQRAFAAFDGMRKEEGEKHWEEARLRAAEADRLSRAASAELEAAIALDGSREDMHERLASLLYRRVVAAEREHQDALRDELAQRMKVHDVTGEYGAKLEASAAVEIETDPPGADVVVERYTLPPEGAATLGERRELGRAPVGDLELVPGSYLFTLRAPDRVEVRYPVVFGRGRRYALQVELPRPEQIPEGYVHVPGGRFLFGSSDADILRKSFLLTVPLHEVVMDPYLICRHETTFGEWIEYLTSLPAGHPARHSVQTGQGDFFGGVRLEQTPAEGWRLELRSTTKAFSARYGENIVFPGRRVNQRVNWLRMPVTGVTFEEASGFSAWLGATGRVPGAHICTDFEWERAARGADERLYPHGNDLSGDEANIGPTYGVDPDSAGPDEVGMHPQSISPFGVEDMAGNVFEWTRSSLEPDEVVQRSGAYFYDKVTARSSNRTVVEKTYRDPRFGLRICAPLARR